jgi:hypothetical protein
MPDRIALMGVLDEFGLRCRTRGEVQQERIGGVRRAVRRELRRGFIGGGKINPAVVRGISRPSNFASSALSTTTNFASPICTRSRTSSAESWVVAGSTMAPSFIAASITSQSSTRLGSISSRRSPRPTPILRRKFAIRAERSDICANEYFVPSPARSSTIHSAGLPLPCAITSK